MTNQGIPVGSAESADRRSRALQKPGPIATDRPAWVLAELTRTGAGLPRTNGPGPGSHRIEWVRPTDLAPRISAGIMTRGADAHHDAHAWVRTRLRNSTARSDRAGRLPPPSAFGNNGPTPTRRDAIGR
jgi:hypothetical protein